MKFRRLCLAMVVIFSASGCVLRPVEAEDPAILFSAVPDFQTNRFFRAVVEMPNRGQDLERKKIDYLMDRLGNSQYEFVRNGRVYSGKRAAAHLRMKYLRSKNEESMTAEAFITGIANRSKASGEQYWMKTQDGKVFSCYTLMVNELRVFDRAVDIARKESLQNNTLKENYPAAEDSQG